MQSLIVHIDAAIAEPLLDCCSYLAAAQSFAACWAADNWTAIQGDTQRIWSLPVCAVGDCKSLGCRGRRTAEGALGGAPRMKGKRSYQVATFRTMVTQLLQHERIQTTLARAKELRKLADKMITLGKKGTRTAQVQAGAVVRTERELHKLFTVLAGRYREREGGYTRVLKTGLRRYDATEMALIELVDRQGELRPARPPSNSHLPASARAYLGSRQPQQQHPHQ